MSSTLDTALLLRIGDERGELFTDTKINQFLAQSQLIKKILNSENSHSNPILSLIFKLSALSEIPYSSRLPEVQVLIEMLKEKASTGQGFSYTGHVDDIVPCYNAMVLEAFARFGLAKTHECQNALAWIKRYQLFERNQVTEWRHKGIYKHGGCLGKTPCYIGIGKTVRALITYRAFCENPDQQIDNLIAKGLSYMKKHQFFLRLSANQPISKHITENIFPQSYFLSLTDLIYIYSKGDCSKQQSSEALLELLKGKQMNQNQQYKIDYLYRYPGYVSFDNRRGKSEWLTFLYPHWLKGTQIITKNRGAN
ncbi:hypothetical protein HOY36_09365 [Enterococcus sp. MMGLQ5-2]|nr:hypothetical protein [Enterococcus sp. MMGLQ5-2]MBS7584056.1 hypothetical protein [Enterococcus sp. MMGLQ5-1]NPD11917.1 hypothetical protein [Enterococcus sp. MMGLQ5-1]NPD37580.1 hypothetical protein [Enterococcus sp. MMGLQ5-2]